MASCKTDKIIRLAKEKTAEKERLALNAISGLIAGGQKVTFYSIAKETGLSKTFLYNNNSVRRVIEEARETGPIDPAPSLASADELLEAIEKLRDTDPDGYKRIRSALSADKPKKTKQLRG
jgi:hypothetical protein